MTQADVVQHAVRTLDRLRLPFMLVGSYGSSIHGEPRMTQDIDILFDLTPIDVSDFCAAFPSPDFFLHEPAVREAVRDQFQFNVLCPASGDKIDFLFPHPSEWGRSQLSRRQAVELQPGLVGYTASPEDVIVGKLWYYHDGGSEKHLRDIAGILRVTGDGVDRDAVGRWADQLGYTPIWHAILDRLGLPK